MSKKHPDRLSEQLRGATWKPMSDEARSSHLAAIDAAVRQARPVPAVFRGRRRFTTIAVAAALLVLPAGIAVAAEGSLPGDVLYPVKRVTETVRGWVDGDVAAEHRVEELEQLVSEDAPAAAIEDQVARAQLEVDRLGARHELRPRLADAVTDAAGSTRGEDVVTADGPLPVDDRNVPPPTTVPTTTPPESDTPTTTPPTTTLTDGRTTVVTPPPTIAPPATTVPRTTVPPSTLPPSDSTTTTLPPGAERNRVVGFVHAGPTCPVQRFPPDPDCADRPVPGAVLIVTTKDGAEVERAESDDGGRFSLQLPDGAYVLRPQPVDGLLGTAAEQAFTVEGGLVELDVAYDTGIR